MIAKFLSQLSCKTLHVCSAICTSADNSIMWSVMEKLLSWMRVFACTICFCSASMLGRIIFWISTNVDLILASSLSNYASISLKNLILLKCAKLELGSRCNCWTLALRSSSILDNLSFISLVNFEISHNLQKSDDTLVQEVSREPKMVESSTW